jgi:shikimate dehydrogenase
MKKHAKKKIFGLIGFPLKHSFSKSYFNQKFQDEDLKDYEYVNFELENIENFPYIIQQNPELIGLNVTIPYKEKILKYVDEMDEKVKKTGAANTLLIKDGQIKAYNTDVYGFKESLLPLLEPYHQQALVLGTGGAAKAVGFVLSELHIPHLFVSRKPEKISEIGYKKLTKDMVLSHLLVINTTPLGTYPAIEKYPSFPYDFITRRHLFYDLIYNPPQTIFLKKASGKGAKTCNGLKMLHLQAEKSWEIWQEKSP